MAAFYGWLHEPVTSSAPCAYYSGSGQNTNGHRWLILKSAGSAVGTGFASGGSWGRYYTGDFGNGGEAGKVVSGVHYPRSGANIDFRASWHDSQPPSSASVVVDGTAHAMSIERGTATSGSWIASVRNLSSGCHAYYFSFRDASGASHRYPASGVFGLGDGCSEWTRIGPVRGDFNSDGHPDLIWRNSLSGAVNTWFLNGTTYTAGASLFTVADSNWIIAGTGDFNGDAKADLLWRNNSTGAVNVWFLDGATYIAGASLFTVGDLAWRIVGVSDFNGDAKPDLAWRHSTSGAVNVWFLDGTTYTGGASLFTVSDSNWKIDATGDMNGDGKTDLVWRNYATGAVNVWYLDGTTYVRGASLFAVADPNWKVEALADYNGDGEMDLIWRNYATGAVNAWFLDGSTYLAGAALYSVPDPNWSIGGPR